MEETQFLCACNSPPVPSSPALVSCPDGNCARSQPSGFLSRFLETTPGAGADSAGFRSHFITPGRGPAGASLPAPSLSISYQIMNHSSKNKKTKTKTSEQPQEQRGGGKPGTSTILRSEGSVPLECPFDLGGLHAGSRQQGGSSTGLSVPNVSFLGLRDFSHLSSTSPQPFLSSPAHHPGENLPPNLLRSPPEFLLPLVTPTYLSALEKY